jgi:hypothetical protein
MKLEHFVFFSALLFGNLMSSAQALPTILLSPPNTAKVHFERESHDFGNIAEGRTVQTSFRFMNSGEVPLLIYKVNVSCGCTVAAFPQTPIPPGETGEITVHFDSKKRPGQFTQPVSVVYNSDQSPALLSFEGTVIHKTK